MLENIDLVRCQYTELRDFSVSMLSCLEAEAEKVDGWIDLGLGIGRAGVATCSADNRKFKDL